jgi:dCTP diphosphatase
MLTFGQLQTLASSHYFKHPLSTRHLIFELAAMVGMLSSSFLQHAPLDPSRPALGDLDEAPVPPAVSWTPPEEIRVQMGEMLYQLALCSISCRLDLQECVNTKLALNAKKYPVELCKGQSGKYTEYSDQTGITKTVGQSTSIGEAPKGSAKNGKPSKEDESIVDMQHKITAFSTERLWSRFHTPRNLVLALLGELGELAEIYQWRGDDRAESNVTKKEDLDHVGQELADVTIYLLRLAAVCRFKIGDQTLQVCVKKANM